MAKTQAEKDEAKQAAKAAVAEKKAERAAELDAPLEDAEPESVASLAAEGLSDGGALSDEEVQRVSGAALASADEAKFADTVVVLIERVEQQEIMIGKLEHKVAELEAKLYKLARQAGVTVKDDTTLHGKIDDLKM